MFPSEDVTYSTTDNNEIIYIRFAGYIIKVYKQGNEVNADICVDEPELFPLTGCGVEYLGLFKKQ